MTTAAVPLIAYYQDEAVTLYHGDARAILPTLAPVDHVITDPPYDAMTHDGARWNQGRDAGRIAFAPLDVATVAPLLVAAATRWAIAFCSLEMLGDYKRAAGVAWVRAGVWHRRNGAPQFTGDRPAQPCEGVAIMHREGVELPKRWNGHGGQAFWETAIVSSARGGRLHPTQKPESLIASIVAAFSDPGDVILDPFAGSGTTLVAAKRLGRRAIGIELNENDCASAAARLQQGALFVAVEGADDV